MSMDKSLKTKGSLARHRNVLTRPERILHLQEAGHWTEDSSPLGLPKVAHRKVAVAKKKSKKEEAEEQAAEGEAAPAAEEKK